MDTAYCWIHKRLEVFQYLGGGPRRLDSHVERRVLLECGRQQVIVQPAEERS